MKYLALSALLILLSLPLQAHSVDYSILSENAIKIELSLGGGELMGGADILVFPPDEEKAAYTLKSDDQGCFFLTPDREGLWILQVRGEAGHGLRINLPVNEEMIGAASLPGGSSLSLLQKIIMILAVGWGAMGTALYFKRRD